MNSPRSPIVAPIAILTLAASLAINARAGAGTPTNQDGGFTYQGVLRQNGQLYNGTADFEFRLYDGPVGTGATQIGPTLSHTVTITDGSSNTILPFEQPPPAPPVWDGHERWLEVRVRTPAGSANPFVALTPWQKVTSAPYAAYALNAAALPATYGNAITLSNAGNVFAGNGAGLASLNAASVTTGNLASARLPTAGTWALSSNLNIDSFTLVLDPVNNRVGIGTSSPDTPLDVSGNPIQQDGSGFFSGGIVRVGVVGAILMDGHGLQGVDSLTLQAGRLDLNSYGGNVYLGGATGKVGIGNPFPTAKLHISGNAGLVDELLENNQSGGDARLRINSNGGAQTLEFRDVGDTNADAIIGIGGAGGESLAFSCGSFTRMLIDNATGHIMLGFGAATGQTGEATLHILDGSAGTITANTNSSLVLERSLDNYLSMLTPDASEAGILFGQASQTTAGGILFNSDVADGLDFRTGGNIVRMDINNLGNVGIGTVGHSIDAVLHVQSDNARVAKFDRYTSDGELVAFARDDGVIGNITVAGGTVSYNAFTGSHFARLDDDAPVGALVSLTGDNDTLADRANGETIYGVKTTARANDPAVLGVYIGGLRGEDFNHPRDIAQIAALGNGDLWVIDTGSSIAPGDYLIASDTPGCAMKDDPSRFAVGNIIARAASRVDWSAVPPDAAGHRRARISVLFGNFVRGAPGGETSDFGSALADRDREIESLREEMAQMRATLRQLLDQSRK